VSKRVIAFMFFLLFKQERFGQHAHFMQPQPGDAQNYLC